MFTFPTTLFSAPPGGGALPSPIAYYKFNDGAGTVATDSSGNGYNANAVAPNPTWGAGKFNGGGVFSGGGYYANTTFAPATINGVPFTVAGWINLNAGVTADSGWFSLGNTPTGDNILHCKMNASGTALFFGMYSDDLSVTGLADMRNAWQHVVCTVDASKNQTLYLNGTQVGTRVATAFLTVTANMTLGREAASGTTWTGILDEIRLYNVSLTPAQVTALFNLVPGP